MAHGWWSYRSRHYSAARIAGEYFTISIFDVDSVDEIHELISGLPLVDYMSVTVTPPATHPSTIAS